MQLHVAYCPIIRYSRMFEGSTTCDAPYFASYLIFTSKVCISDGVVSAFYTDCNAGMHIAYSSLDIIIIHLVVDIIIIMQRRETWPWSWT